MKYRGILLALATCAVGLAWAESEDPSYEPNRYSPKRSKPDEQPAKIKNSDKNQKAQPPIETVQAPARVQADGQTERKVLLILNGKPIYADDPDAPRILAEIKADAKGAAKADSKPAKSRDKKTSARENIDGALAPSVYVPPVEQRSPVPPPTILTPADDLTADKPGTPSTAQNPALLEEIPIPAGPLSSRATSAYKQLAELKKNIETVSRCMDNRGKENALLVHCSEEAVQNMTDMAAIWPKHEEFIERCTVVKRDALILSNELNHVPWKWAEVRWSFSALLKSVKPFRAYAKALAEAEPAPRPKLNKQGKIMLDKEGKTIYEDAPDPTIDVAAAQREARLKAQRDELEQLKRGKESRSEAKKNKLDTDLDGN